MAKIADGLGGGTPYLDYEHAQLQAAESYIGVAAGDGTRIPEALYELLAAIVRLTNKCDDLHQELLNSQKPFEERY